ncbi:MAG: hypothetical protein GVY17_13340 [Cyanobacteria bacterium]|nr:hypothetical protein [Cyanobacteria bacterium GSL.Bin21]
MMLRSLTLSLSALVVAFGSVNLPVNANPLSSFLLNSNLAENKDSFSRIFNNGKMQISQLNAGEAVAQAPQSVPEVIVDTIPDDGSSSSSSGGVVVESESSTSTTVATERRFTCEYNNGQYTVMYNPESQPNASYPWAIPQQMGGNWSPERRCREISQRLELYRPDGLLELRTSVMNNEDIVCVTSEVDPSCRIVFTVPRGQDPIATRDRVFDNLADANEGIQTRGVNTFTSNSNWRDLLRGNARESDESINLRPFLDPADGGTGEQLRSANSPSSLDPSLFR